MEEILYRIQQREEAVVKRERAMAYAFSHQVHLPAMENIDIAIFIWYLQIVLNFACVAVESKLYPVSGAGLLQYLQRELGLELDGEMDRGTALGSQG